MIEQNGIDACVLQGILQQGKGTVAGSLSGLPPSPASTPTLTSTKKRKTLSSRVTFDRIETLVFIETRSEMTEQEKVCRWFNMEELLDMKYRARQLCIQESKGLDVSYDESTRGMDVYFPLRQRHHKKFIDHVLEAYHFRCSGNAEHVRLLVEKWSSKSRQRANDRAQTDYMEVYSS
jgi:hypothetical protein